MRVTVLEENAPPIDRHLRGEPGLALPVEQGGKEPLRYGDSALVLADGAARCALARAAPVDGVGVGLGLEYA